MIALSITSASQRFQGGSLEPPHDEVVEVREAVGLGPQANTPRLAEGLVSRLEELSPIECYRELLALDAQRQGLPAAVRHWHVDAGELLAAAIDHPV